MAEFKGTKEKWVVDFDSEHPVILIKSENVDIATIEDFGDEFREEFEDNAKLIAAAPELLEALIQLKNWTCALKDWSGGTSLDPPIEMAIEAIKKATE